MILASKNLPLQRKAAHAAIDKAAEGRRAEITTPGQGQAMVYLLKHDEARAFLSAYPDPNTAPRNRDPARWPLLSAGICDETPTLSDVAHEIQGAASSWLIAVAAIEQARLAAKRGVRKATTEAAIAEALVTFLHGPIAPTA
jgi:hypothetical protein